ncbi:hypothetical protein ACT3TA_17120 [Halomonas sp. AOP42-C1-46]|uniref:hypothetical protein n=1 Tax=Halomonas sp. AOP42-C1-46 TaxID=3457671 RepID=UPI004033F814
MGQDAIKKEILALQGVVMSDEHQKSEVAQKNKQLKKLNGSVSRYEQPFDPVGNDEWEVLLLEGLTPDTAHADELATPSLKEQGEDPESQR